MMCTYLTQEELKAFTTVADPYLMRLLKEVNAFCGNRFLIQERSVKIYRSFGRSYYVTRYTLYALLVSPEVQVINFDQDTTYSINTTVRKSCYLPARHDLRA